MMVRGQIRTIVYLYKARRSHASGGKGAPGAWDRCGIQEKNQGGIYEQDKANIINHNDKPIID